MEITERGLASIFPHWKRACYFQTARTWRWPRGNKTQQISRTQEKGQQSEMRN